MEIEDALSARRSIDKAFNEARRQYAAIPRRLVREVPVPNAPNIEIPLGAILADDIYAQATDTLFTASPLLTVRPVSDRWTEHAKVAQEWVNWLVANELDLRSAVSNAFLDDTQLGTGVFYIPFVKQTKKDRVYKVTFKSPKILSHPVEDLIVPPGSYGDIQRDRWIGLRFWYTKGEMEERARENDWNIDGLLPTAQFDLVRLNHERKSGLRGTQLWREVFEVIQVYGYYDYDEDGMDEDLLITYDRSSRRILDLQFNPYDIRPVEIMRYQPRAHLPYGIGIMEMIQPFQEELTELHNYTMLNIYLANCRIWAAKEGAVSDTLEIIPGKIVKVNADDVRTAIAELKMSEVYPSAFQAQMTGMQLAERRVGTSGAAGMMAKGGSRTPGVTALSLLQQINRRFAPAFDDMREKTGAAVRQALYRYREVLLSRDKEIVKHIQSVMGEENAMMIIELLTTDDFDHAVAVEFTASNASVNREADRQNAILVANLLGQYYQQTAALAMQAVSQPMPPELQQVLIDIAKKGTELMDRTLRTFDNVRDPKRFLLDVAKVESAVNASPTEEEALMGQLVQSLVGAAGAPGAEGGGSVQPPQLPAPGFSGVA